jgi:ABC-type spermidine/putrescine transport systems, ATPase components
LLGPSGCGKTTTLRLISGFEDPEEGVIEIAGESMVGKRPYERNVGLLFQHYALFPHMTVAENVGYGLKHRRWPKAEIGDRIAEMLRLVQLQGFDGRRPGQMSGGQQQRVALARVLATGPKLVLLDEPLSALDAKLREELRLELKQILTSVGSTTIVVTHDQDEAMSLADRIIIMNRGRIEQQGTPDEIYMRPRTAFVAAFIGRTNWFHGSIEGEPGSAFARLMTDAGTSLAVRGLANVTGQDGVSASAPSA